uniref:Uncharacterized protein n=1 Tax=Mycena chlorophos TaxID=658473 RepID=A0ABQ0KY05_MYCCL|nr:predicted protein [Mycena chlorophos]
MRTCYLIVRTVARFAHACVRPFASGGRHWHRRRAVSTVFLRTNSRSLFGHRLKVYQAGFSRARSRLTSSASSGSHAFESSRNNPGLSKFTQHASAGSGFSPSKASTQLLGRPCPPNPNPASASAPAANGNPAIRQGPPGRDLDASPSDAQTMHAGAVPLEENVKSISHVTKCK